MSFVKLIVFVFTINVLSAQSSRSLPKTNLVFSHHPNNTFHVMRHRPVEIIATASRQQMIFAENVKGLRYLCQVEELNPEFSINKAWLCLKESLTAKPNCSDVTSRNVAQFQSGQFNVTFDPVKGFIADLVVGKSQQISGFLNCQLRNPIDHLVSSYIEIVNLQHLGNLIDSEYEEVGEQVTSLGKEDNIIHCGRKSSSTNPSPMLGWLRPMIGNQFKWFLCPATKLNNCYEPLSKVLKENEHYQLFSNYSVQLFDSVFDKFDTEFQIQCSRKDSSLYSSHKLSKPFRKKSFTAADEDNIMVYSPLQSSVEIREGEWPQRFYRLSASYKSSAVSFVWLKDGQPISDTFQSDNHTLTFPAKITLDLRGNYSLEVHQASKPSAKVVFQFNVAVLSLPMVINDFDGASHVVYVMMGKSLNLSVRFRGEDFNTSVEINDLTYSTSELNRQERGFERLKKRYPHLKTMSIKISEFKGDTFKEVRYQADRIGGVWFKNGLSHRVTFVGSSAVGETRKSVIVKAIEKPRWKSRLSDFECTENCLSNEIHTFQCAVFAQEYADVGLQVDYQWRVNGVRLETLFGKELVDVYFSIARTGTLVLKRIATSNSVRDLRVIEKLQNATLSCSVSISFADKRQNGGKIKLHELYNSWSDPLSQEFSRANVHITGSQPYQGGFSTTLVWIIVVPLVLLLLIFASIIGWQYHQTKAHTYNIDQNERSAGKDPEKETFEAIYFQHYTRENESDFKIPSIKEEHSLWSADSSKEDIKEIDNYDIDAEVFDEGSIVGEYGKET